MASQTTFSLEYILSLIVALLGYFMVNKSAPQSALWLKLLVGLFAGYLSLLIFNSVIPGINSFGTAAKNYVVKKTTGGINGMDYIYIFPPLFIVLVIFLALLYNGSLG